MVAADMDSPVGFSPDGKAMAFLRFNPQARQANLVIANSDGTGEKALAARNAPDSFGGPPDWSPDGKRIAIHSFAANGTGALQTIDVASGRTNEVADSERSSSSSLEILPARWMPDGKGLVTTYHSQAKGVLHLQLGYVAYPSGKLSRITNDLNDYSRWALSVTSDGKSLVTVQTERRLGLWTMPAEANGSGKAQQIGRDKDEGLAIAWTRDGRILTNRDKSDFVLRNADGTNKATVYSAGAPAYGGAICGNYLVMAGGEAGKGRNILRVDLSRGVMKQLTFGEWNASPACSPDGQWIVYASSDTANPGIFKIHIDGGAAQKISGLEGDLPTFSPDGKQVAFLYFEGTRGNWRWAIAVISANVGTPPQTYEANRGSRRRILFEEPFGKIQFTPDGTGLIYPVYDGEVDNLWIQPLSGRPLKPLTFFKSGLIEDYAVSPDGKSIALLRGQLDRDVVLIKDAAR
jgi:Tol biopolymer transport system component